MKWNILTKLQRIDIKIRKQCVWHIWFAWRPVSITNEHGKVSIVWLEKVGRKRTVDLTSDWHGVRSLSIWGETFCFKDDALVNKLKSDTIYLYGGKLYEGINSLCSGQ